MNELGPEARAIFDAGRNGDDPTAADRARIRASLQRAIAGHGGGSSGTAGGTSPAGEAAVTLGAKSGSTLAWGWKVFAAVGVAAIGAVGLLAALRGDPPSTFGGAETPPNPPAGSAQRMDPPPTPAPATPPEPAPPAPASPERHSPPLESRREPKLPVEPPPAHATPAPAQPVTMGETPKPPAEPVTMGETPKPPAQPVPAPPAADPDTLAAETRRLREARAALKGGDATRALSLLDEQSAAGAQLREERAAARILALCDLGRTDEARAAAARFLAESPRSPMADRVRASCGGH